MSVGPLYADPSKFGLDVNGSPTIIGGNSLVGVGVPLMRFSNQLPSQTGAVNILSNTPNFNATWTLQFYVLVTTATNHSFTMTCAFTDSNGSARTATLNFFLVAGGALTQTIANAAGAVPYMGIPFTFRSQLNQSIVVATTGTFTTVTYEIGAALVQIGG
jgi:hypothetical protein